MLQFYIHYVWIRANATGCWVIQRSHVVYQNEFCDFLSKVVQLIRLLTPICNGLFLKLETVQKRELGTEIRHAFITLFMHHSHDHLYDIVEASRFATFFSTCMPLSEAARYVSISSQLVKTLHISFSQ
ncbi:unnamed protein product [Amoebophrya sp. A120]|nr:unnamed protein product [Amoebophrya sp. A120]|eukprot:GSA120T00020399001.1